MIRPQTGVGLERWATPRTPVAPDADRVERDPLTEWAHHHLRVASGPDRMVNIILFFAVAFVGAWGAWVACHHTFTAPRET